MKKYTMLGRFLAVAYLSALCVLCLKNDIADPGNKEADPLDNAQQQADIARDKLDNSEGRFYEFLKDNISKRTPVEALDEMSKDVTREMQSNPYFQLPKLDRKLREIAVLHPDVMETLGVYVIPVKGNTSGGEENITNEAGPLPEVKEDKASKPEDPLQQNLSHIIKQSEMIKAMTPEEKLSFIPRLKDTIVYEILKNSQKIEELTKQIAEMRMHENL